MTPEELVDKLYECDTGDEEKDHRMADDLLLKFINDIRITIAFESVSKWYA